nr:MAG: ORF1 [Torque teno midi virus]
MPFWWKRRRRPWFYNNRYKRRRYKKRRFRRRLWRRKPRRAPRRRRRRRKKVRRKKKKIPLTQWQPESIVKCKIKGIDCMVLGGEGKQLLCFTDEKDQLIPPRTPGGGGIGFERYSLEYLYGQYKQGNNIWTKSNETKDLCRYQGCTIKLYRHPEQDFIVSYSNQPPFTIDKYTYPSCHPQQQLLQKKKKIVYSLVSRPRGKAYTKIFIKPPRQMIDKWFFQEIFTKYTLFTLKASVCNMNYSFLGCCNENWIVGMFNLNTSFYQDGSFGMHRTDAYKPYSTASLNLNYVVQGKTTEEEKQLQITNTYYSSISYDKGWFNTEFLNCKYVGTKASHTATNPITIARYNPFIDTGRHNKIYITSTLKKDWDPPTTDKSLLLEGLPLWLGLLGYLSYVEKIKNDTTFLESHLVVLESDAFYTYSQIGGSNKVIPIDPKFVQGKAPYDQYLTSSMKKLWFPTIKNQMETLNAIVSCGPYMPKLANRTNSTWELKLSYLFHFKWGGPQVHNEKINDPETQGEYDGPFNMQQRLQIKNPEKLKTQSILHSWDFRRGIVTSSALKRMHENLSIDTSLEPDTEEPQQKKKKYITNKMPNPYQENQEIQECLQSLCQEEIFQEETPQHLQQLIYNQQQQQQQLKQNLLILLADVKRHQRMIELQTGLLD